MLSELNNFCQFGSFILQSVPTILAVAQNHMTRSYNNAFVCFTVQETTDNVVGEGNLPIHGISLHYRLACIAVALQGPAFVKQLLPSRAPYLYAQVQKLFRFHIKIAKATANSFMFLTIISKIARQLGIIIARSSTDLLATELHRCMSKRICLLERLVFLPIYFSHRVLRTTFR